jgi:hypothetical protein
MIRWTRIEDILLWIQRLAHFDFSIHNQSAQRLLNHRCIGGTLLDLSHGTISRQVSEHEQSHFPYLEEANHFLSLSYIFNFDSVQLYLQRSIEFMVRTVAASRASIYERA